MTNIIAAIRDQELVVRRAEIELGRLRADAVGGLCPYQPGMKVTLDFCGRNRKAIIEVVSYHGWNEWLKCDQAFVQVRFYRKNGQTGLQTCKFVVNLSDGSTAVSNLKIIEK